MSDSSRKLLSVGSLFGDYRILKELGHGGMGVVYLAEDVHDASRVAIKVLYPDSEQQDHEFVLRFIREAEIAMTISHPNLIQVQDVGRDPVTHLGFMIMEYVPGGSVGDRLTKRGAFGVRQAHKIIQSVASALDEASKHGVVHRDIKPDNILFSEDGTVRLSDLGIAKQDGLGQTTLTVSNMIIGTPAYMAPEQLMNSHKVDIRADIYSLGVAFWEMLAGKLPYEDDSSMAVMARMARGEAIPDIRKVRPNVSPAVAMLIRKMTAPDVRNRLQTPREVVDFVDKFHRRQKMLAGGVIAGSVLVAVAAVLGVAWFLFGRESGKMVERPVPKVECPAPRVEQPVRKPVQEPVPEPTMASRTVKPVAERRTETSAPRPTVVPVAVTNAAVAVKEVKPLPVMEVRREKKDVAAPAVPKKPAAPVTFSSAAVEYLELVSRDERNVESKVVPVVNSARQCDPDFSLFDWNGNRNDGGSPLRGKTLDEFRRGMTYLQLELFRRKNGRLPNQEELAEIAAKMGAPAR